MQKIWKKLILLFIILTVMPACFAQGNASKELFLSKDKVYLLVFNSKVQRYSAGDYNAFAVELLNSIYNDKWQILIKPKKNANTNLIVWTDKGAFNFDIKIEDKNSNRPKIIDIKEAGVIPSSINEQLGGLDLDSPPVEQQEVSDFILDKPPLLKEENDAIR